MLDNVDIRTALVAWLKANSTIVATLEDANEIREKDWQGEDFSYPNIRVTTSSTPDRCNFTNVDLIVSFYSEQKSSKEALTGQGIIAKQLHEKSIQQGNFIFSTVRVTSLPDAVQLNGVWKADVNLSAIVYSDPSQYWRKVYDLGPIAYWPLWDAGGPTVKELVSGMNGTASSVTFLENGIGDGKNSVLFDGTTSYIDIYSSALNSAFNGQEGSLVIWTKMFSSDIWTDGNNHYIFRLLVDGNNQLALRKGAANSSLGWDYIAGGTNKSIAATGYSTTDWFHIAFTWSKSNDQLIAYYKGTQVGSIGTGLGAWSGSLSSSTAVIGAQNNTPLNSWSGYLAHAALFDKILTLSQIATLATV